jgi:hypothetical protein
MEGAHADIEFTNVGSGPCILRGLPWVAIVQADGTSLPVQQVLAPDLSVSPVVLPSADWMRRISSSTGPTGAAARRDRCRSG